MSDDYERFCECDELKEQYNQGRADAINECIELVLKTCFVHFPCDDETIDFYLTVKQDVMKRMEQLKEQNK